jgi:hypothetical protein
MSKVKYVTPAGSAQYPWLQPGRPDTAFDEAGKYKLNLRLSQAEAKDLIALVNASRDDQFAPKDTVRLPYKSDEETGDISFSISSKFQPKYYDSKGNPIVEAKVPLLYSGSTLRASGMCEGYTSGVNKGIALRLAAIQVIEPVSGSGGSAGDFDAVEGFTAATDGGVAAEEGDFDF